MLFPDIPLISYDSPMPSSAFPIIFPYVHLILPCFPTYSFDFPVLFPDFFRVNLPFPTAPASAARQRLGVLPLAHRRSHDAREELGGLLPGGGAGGQGMDDCRNY